MCPIRSKARRSLSPSPSPAVPALAGSFFDPALAGSFFAALGLAAWGFSALGFFDFGSEPPGVGRGGPRVEGSGTDDTLYHKT